MSKTAFISRDLAPDSAFRMLLERQGWRVTGVSLIELSPVTFTIIPPADWLFFYSKNGVHYFFSQLSPAGKAKAAAMSIAAYGPATAEAVRAAGYNVSFTGTGQAESTAPAFARLAAGRRVLFPQAAQSRQALLPYLPEGIRCEEIVVYENKPRKNVELPITDYVVLTSPLNAISYLENVTPQSFQRYVAIGDTTAKALRDAGIGEVLSAAFPSEVSLAMAIFELENDKNHHS